MVHHVVPLFRGGADAIESMQWQTNAEAETLFDGALFPAGALRVVTRRHSAPVSL